jgi:hypothetical protein
VWGNLEVIFDTGTTLMVGNRRGIGRFYAELSSFGVDSQYYGSGCYTSTWTGGASDNA